MAKKSKKPKKSAGNTDVESYKHEAAKRKNIPTAENQSLVADDDKTVKVLRYPRNPDLDPQLVWRGKDEENGQPLEVAAPPIYIQEKIHPQALIEKLKQQTQDRQAEQKQQADFFSDFNGLPEGWHADATASYYHDEGNWQNRMILGDSLLVMGSLAEREALRGKVQCIYFDPPYGIKFNSNWQPSTKSSDIKEDRSDNITREPEVVRAFRDTWKDGINSYLSYLRDRIALCRDLLSERGSFFIQIGDENVHIVRSLCDEVFGPDNFISQITVQKSGAGYTVYLPGICDYIIWYGKDASRTKFKEIYRDRGVSAENAGRFTIIELSDGQRTSLSELGAVPADARMIAPDPIQSSSQGREKGEGASNWFPVAFNGNTYRPNEKRRWSTNEQGFERLKKASRIIAQKTAIRFARYLDDFNYVPLNNIWSDTSGATDRIYVVQTAEKVVERCILMATDPGDLVLDPTCGSGTSAYVAEQWGRR